MATLREADLDQAAVEVRILFVHAAGSAPEPLANTLEESGVEVVAVAANEALAAIERLHPDILVSDVDGVGEDALRLIERIRALPPEAGGAIPAIAVGDGCQDFDRLSAAGYEALRPRSTAAAEVVDLVAEAALGDAASNRFRQRIVALAEQQRALRRKLVDRRKTLENQRIRLAISAARRDAAGLPVEPAVSERASRLVEMPADTPDLAANRILARLPDRELSHLRPGLSLMRLAADRTLYFEGGRVDFAYFPLTCIATHVSVMRSGKLVETGSIGNDGMIGLGIALETKRAPCWTRVQVPGLALRIGATTLEAALGECPALRSMLLRYAQAQIFVLMQSTVCNRLHRVEEQLARTLLTIAGRLRSRELPLTHERLSEMLGTTRPSITLAAQALEDEGAIRRSYGRIQVVDVERLRMAACECYELIRGEFERLLTGPEP